MKNLLMKFILVVMASFITTLSNAQTFKCTSIEFGEECSTSKQQDMRVQVLGAKLECEKFASDIKVTLSYEDDGEQKKEIVVFVKKDFLGDDIYEYKDRKHLTTLKFEKTLGFITKILMQGYDREKHEYSATFERELF